MINIDINEKKVSFFTGNKALKAPPGGFEVTLHVNQHIKAQFTSSCAAFDNNNIFGGSFQHNSHFAKCYLHLFQRKFAFTLVKT